MKIKLIFNVLVLHLFLQNCFLLPGDKNNERDELIVLTALAAMNSNPSYLFVGSCRWSDDTMCINYYENSSATYYQSLCTDYGNQWNVTSHCPTSNLQGTCKWINGDADRQVEYFYNSFSSDPMAACPPGGTYSTSIQSW